MAKKLMSPLMAKRSGFVIMDRGIPLGKVLDAVSKMNTGAKYDSKAFKNL